MTLVSPKTVLLVVQTVKAKPNSALFGQNPLCLNPLSRFLSRAFNSSVSCQQTSVDVCEHLGGEVHEGMQVQLSESLEKKVQYKGGEVLEGDVQVRLSAKLEHKVHQGVPLGDVVKNCVRRWFKEYLKKAKEGDPDSQTTVGQMFSSGYGVPRDLEKGQVWIKQAEWKRKSLASTKGLYYKRRTEDDEYFFV